MLPYMLRFVARQLVTLALRTVVVTVLGRVAQKSPRGNKPDNTYKVSP